MTEEKKESSEEVTELKTVLIIGISSFVGSNLAQFFKKHFRVVGTYHKNPVRISGIMTLPMDVLNKDEVQLIIYAFKPDLTIYCTGMSSLAECSVFPEMAEAINTNGLFNVAEYCSRYKSQIAYLSSPFVFAGENKNYLEMDTPDATTVYGKTLASAEFYLQKQSLNYIVFRVCKLYGRGFTVARPTWFERCCSNLAQNKPIALDGYVNTGFLDVSYLGLLIKICFDRGVKNRLMQVNSKDITTHYEFMKKAAKLFEFNQSLIEKTKWTVPIAPTVTSVPEGEELYYKLDVSNVEGFLKVDLPTIEESLQFTFNRFNGVEKKKRKKEGSGSGVTFI